MTWHQINTNIHEHQHFPPSTMGSRRSLHSHRFISGQVSADWTWSPNLHLFPNTHPGALRKRLLLPQRRGGHVDGHDGDTTVQQTTMLRQHVEETEDGRTAGRPESRGDPTTGLRERSWGGSGEECRVSGQVVDLSGTEVET